ncbi:MAG: formylglycine-generating enzyme family protein [Proteobacteria bacterium]|nr:MAG: formylglycine-generating enzyme family protein [Pseudomonadota bacterium]
MLLFRALPTTSCVALLGCLVSLLACESQRSADRTQPNAPARSADDVPQSLPVIARPASSAVAERPAADAGATEPGPAPEAPANMALVPAGPFTMGADSGGEQDEHPAHVVTLDAFYLDLTEVTQEAYLACVDAKACEPPKLAYLESFGGAFRGPKRPVVGVNQANGAAFCAHLGKRLPREAEFEKAVRGDTRRRYPWGDQPPTAERAVFGGDVTADVGTHPEGRGPYGHHDLAGNVWEWMSDAYDPYAYRRAGAARGEVGTCEQVVEFQNELRRTGQRGYTGTNPIPTTCEAAIRGGAYNMGAEALRASNRVHHPGNFRLQMTGFRCAKDVTRSGVTGNSGAPP